ncbi:MAG: hypothetical protein ACC653_02515 [Gammaproteobacteria bacterium]
MKVLTKLMICTTAVFGLAFNVEAQVRNSLPGAMCQSLKSTEQFFLKRQTNGIENVSNRPVVVLCGLPASDVESQQRGAIRIWVMILESNEKRTCNAYSNREDGSTSQEVENTREGYGWLGLDLTDLEPSGTTVVTCELLPGARLSTVKYEENYVPNGAALNEPGQGIIHD